jgi:hypothetical protein
MQANLSPPAHKHQYGEFNLWDLYDLDLSDTVPCKRASVFFHLLYSEGTNGARAAGVHVGNEFADMILYGPVTDDAAYGAGRLLTQAEVDGVTSYEGFEAMACLRAEHRLYKWQVAQHFPTEEDKDNLVNRFRELGLNSKMFSTLCAALGLRRVK